MDVTRNQHVAHVLHWKEDVGHIFTVFIPGDDESIYKAFVTDTEKEGSALAEAWARSIIEDGINPPKAYFRYWIRDEA